MKTFSKCDELHCHGLRLDIDNNDFAIYEVWQNLCHTITTHIIFFISYIFECLKPTRSKSPFADINPNTFLNTFSSHEKIKDILRLAFHSHNFNSLVINNPSLHAPICTQKTSIKNVTFNLFSFGVFGECSLKIIWMAAYCVGKLYLNLNILSAVFSAIFICMTSHADDHKECIVANGLRTRDAILMS